LCSRRRGAEFAASEGSLNSEDEDEDEDEETAEACDPNSRTLNLNSKY
jgi:hypothetical protein